MIPAGTFKNIEQLNQVIDTTGAIYVNKDMVIVLIEYYMNRFYDLSEDKTSNLQEYMFTAFTLDYLCNQLQYAGTNVSDIIAEIQDKLNLRQADDTLSVFVDGSALGNDIPDKPNRAATAFAVICKGEVVKQSRQYIGDKSNTEAEYKALEHALVWLVEAKLTDRPIVLYSDSEVAVNQVNMVHRTKSKDILPMRNRVRNLMRKFNDIRLVFIPGRKNKLCDRLAKSMASTEKEDRYESGH